MNEGPGTKDFLTKIPSRTLNHTAVAMGLSFTDFTGLGLLLIALQTILKPLQHDFLALVVTVGAGGVLSAVRLRYRRQIIRDYLLSLVKSKQRT